MERVHVQFDAQTRLLARERSRRSAIGVLLGALGIGALEHPHVEAKKNNKNKKNKKKRKKKGHRCMTVGNAQVTCRKGEVCCDPTRGSGAGCAPPESPVCCVSTGFAHEADIVCCASNAEGSAGICTTSHPHCCPPGIYGCCEAGYPVCCSTPLATYCCPSGTACCATDPTGCCAVGRSAPVPDAADAKPGTWLPAVRPAGETAAYTRIE